MEQTGWDSLETTYKERLRGMRDLFLIQFDNLFANTLFFFIRTSNFGAEAERSYIFFAI